MYYPFRFKILLSLCIFNLTCMNEAAYKNPCDPTNRNLINGIILKSAMGDNTSLCGINPSGITFGSSNNLFGPSIIIQNLKDKSSVYSGFMIGTASDQSGITKVEVAFDNDTYFTAQGTTNWKMKLPSGSSTWRDGSKHIIKVRATNSIGITSASTNITVYKDRNHDINGDGYSDLVTTSRAAAPGIVYIFHSSGINGITATSTNVANTVITGEGASTFGDFLVTGDINGDGFADLVVSDTGFSSNLGKVYIFYSSGNNGITTTLASAAPKTLLGTNSYFGYGLDLGDVNGDGYADLAVNNTIGTTGAVYVFHSGASGITASNLAGANTTIAGVGTDDISIFVSMGDYNGDGFTDLSVSSNTAPVTNRGRVFIFHSSGPNGIIAVNTTSAVATITGAANNDVLGYSMTSGDINGDGYADLVVGGDQYTSGTPIGKVSVFLSNGSSGINVTPSAVYNGENSGARLGGFVWIMDVNGDGFKDVLMASAYFNGGQGKMYIFHSSKTGVPAIPLLSANQIVLGEPGSGRFAAGISGSDINGDGYGDIICSANVLNNTQDGRVYVMYSNGTTGISTTNASSATTKIDPLFNSNKRFGFQVY